jgi:hypothetical protein
MTTDTSDPAFPVFPDTGAGHAAAHKGLTIRDYFAAKAMQSMCEEVSRYDNFAEVARDAYKMADAMITNRLVPDNVGDDRRPTTAAKRPPDVGCPRRSTS